jgi:Zn-dependent protease with chaperone function
VLWGGASEGCQEGRIGRGEDGTTAAAAPLAQVNPLAAFKGRDVMSLFSTHPATEERVAKLKAMAA